VFMTRARRSGGCHVRRRPVSKALVTTSTAFFGQLGGRTRRTNMADTGQYTPQIGKRADAAARVKERHLPLAQSIGLTVGDLDLFITEVDVAQEADRQQHTQLADMTAERTERALTAEDIFARERQMRDRLLVIISAL